SRLLSTDPATTVLYTLSLHDALPILCCGNHEPQLGAVEVRFAADEPGFIRRRRALSPGVPNHRQSGDFSHRGAFDAHAYFGAAGDRKSTRLNSSHDQISYAVFCLKKK